MSPVTPFPSQRKPRNIEELLAETGPREASDLHLTAYTPPVFRIHGHLVPASEYLPLTPEDIRNLVYPLLTPRQIEVLEKRLSVDLAVSVAGGRFRVNIYHQRGCLACAFRRLADHIPPLESLGLPPSVYRLADLSSGLVLVTGPTGSGKSTTLAALIDRINQLYSRVIITIEDPIEYIHFNKRSVINQRELYTDVESFADALRAALRADPDVILVGEMRDLETMRTAIMAAETGHLVLSTLHARDTVSALPRMIGVFPTEEQFQVRQQLSSSLKAVIAQQLLPRADGQGRVLACEVLMVTSGVANLIRLGKDEHIRQVLEIGACYGMQTMEHHLEFLVKKGLIDVDTALRAARNPKVLEERLERLELGRKR